MARATELSPEQHPWIRPDLLPHAVASAGWGKRYPALCYELGDADTLIPKDVIEHTFMQGRFALAVWQPNRITFIDVSHEPDRTFTLDDTLPQRSQVDWVTIRRYGCATYGPVFTSMTENIDPFEVAISLYDIMATPIGFAPGEQGIIQPDLPVQRLLVEYPGFSESRELPLDTSVGSLGGIATQEYLNTIYTRPKV